MKRRSTQTPSLPHAVAAAVLFAALVWYLGCGGTGQPGGEPRQLRSPADRPPGAGAHAADGQPGTSQMIVVCWDGTRYEHMRQALRQGELPHLARIVASGGMSQTLITDHATETMSAITQMLTGYGPKLTGVRSAQRYRPIPRELSVFWFLNQHFGRRNIFQLWVSSKAKRVSSLPGQAWQYCRLDVDVWDGDIGRPVSTTGPLVLSYLRQYARPGRRFFFFLHFAEPDKPGHAYGEDSPQYHQAILDLDDWLGRILEVLQDAGVLSTTVVCVCSDHGFDKAARTHLRAPDAWFATNVAALRPLGDQKDVAPTILSAFGIDPTSLSTPMPGSALWAEAGTGRALAFAGQQVNIVTGALEPHASGWK